MVGGPLDGGSFNPARWFGPALVGNEWGGVWPYLLGPIVGSLLAAVVFKFVLEAGGAAADRAARAGQARPRRSTPRAHADPLIYRPHRGPQGPRRRRCSSLGAVRRVTFSRNYTLSLSRTCQCYCKYCAFATHQAHIRSPEEVEKLLDEALKRNAKELLVLTGERPEVNPVVAAKLAEWGHDDFTSYVVWACERALERGMLPHTNIGVLDRTDLARLREVTASQGLMLESVSERLMETVHAGSPTKHPSQRLATIEAAGELKIPFTSGILVGIGETEDEQVASLEALAELHDRYGHLQEVILQNFVPHPRYYGAEVADIADEARSERWGGAGDPSGGAPHRDWGKRSAASRVPAGGVPGAPFRTGRARLTWRTSSG